MYDDDDDQGLLRETLIKLSSDPITYDQVTIKNVSIDGALSLKMHRSKLGYLSASRSHFNGICTHHELFFSFFFTVVVV